MPRPCKRRRVCAMPECWSFGPLPPANTTGERISMTVDEFESIRLIDLEGLTQEECAKRMNVARTTAQAIYGSARTKLAKCLVGGNELTIEGGDYILCDGFADDCGCCCGRAYRPALVRRVERTDKMKVAVTYDNGEVFQHFGRTESFKIYTVEDGKITDSKIIGSDGNGHEALVDVIYAQGVDALICGGIGGGAQAAIASVGIQLFPGVTGSADEAAAAFAAGKLDASNEPNCDHHEEHEHGGCCHNN